MNVYYPMQEARFLEMPDIFWTPIIQDTVQNVYPSPYRMIISQVIGMN
jgi:hypothetical protein